jgi:hypothetical protein
MLSRRALVLIASIIIVVSRPAGALPGKEKVTLARKAKTGDRLVAKEHFRNEKEIHWKGEGQGSAGGEEIEVLEREYFQEVAAETPLTLKRDYRVSTRLKGRPKDDRLEPTRTSIHGKTVILRPDGPTLEGGMISQEDRDSLDNYERIAYALLPKQDVALGDEWKVQDEVGRALFRGLFDPTNMKTQGSGKLEAWKTLEGRRAAKLALKAQIQVTPTEVFPACSLDLKGSALFLIDDGIFADVTFECAARYEFRKVDNGKETAWSSDEHATWTLHEGPVLAAPAKPVTKDDELAKAKVLACSKGHRFPNEFQFCAGCGKPLDPTTRRCPGGCAPVLRFCPICGEALAPANEGK